MSKFEIVSESHSQVRRFNLTGCKVSFKIRDVPKETNPLTWMKEAIGEVINYITAGVEPQDKVGFTFDSAGFEERGPGWLSFRAAEDVTFEDVWRVLGGIFMSNTEGLSTDTFTITATTVRMPTGQGKRKRGYYDTFEEECKSRGGIISIDNKDNLCLVRATVVAIAHVTQDPDLKNIRLNRNNRQTIEALKLLNETGLGTHEGPMGIDHLKILQNHLNKYKITVYEYGSSGRDLIFEGPDAEMEINLLHHNDHFNVITSLTSAFACTYYCRVCHIPYNTKNRYRCKVTCSYCQTAPVCVYIEEKYCADCNRVFKSSLCYDNHKAHSSKTMSLCDFVKRCKECFTTYNTKNRKGPHICGEIYCKTCRVFTPAGHLCFMPPNNKQPSIKNTLITFYDLETRQEKLLHPDEDTVVHEPNLCVFMNHCDLCTNSICCTKCGMRTTVLTENVIEGFMKNLLEKRRKFEKVVCIAHNSQGFDAQFILKFVLEQTCHTPELIMRGSKILMMSIENIKFIDSLNYFPMSLSALPKTFELTDSKKGFFPHLFNTTANKDYIGPLPDVEYYSPDSMKDGDRSEFLCWYEDKRVSGYVFNMQRELMDYCISDTEILSQSCLKFRSMFIEECNVDPFTEAITIALACNLVFRRNFLAPNTIGIIPRGGYRCADNQSKIAIQWLIHEEKERNIFIQHAGRQKEVVIPGTRFKVDGFCSETRQVFEFHGCYFHGHESCQPTRRDAPLHESPTDTLNIRLERTRNKTFKLQEMGYEVIDMWECVWRKQIKIKCELRYLQSHPLLNYIPIEPRDAFFGGRTEAIKLYHDCTPVEKIKYFDVCSLYPWVCKYGRFPVGHPRIYVGSECPRDLAGVNGLVKCKILPPQQLFHPVLPLKMNDKLMFALCRTCAECFYSGECMHAIEERVLIGTWVVDEVKKAVEKGYEIIEIYEIWSYEMSTYDNGGLFAGFINKFLKIKQEASGWPSGYSGIEERKRYIAEYQENEGVSGF